MWAVILIRRGMQRGRSTERHGKDSHLRAKERRLRSSRSCMHPALRHLLLELWETTWFKSLNLWHFVRMALANYYIPRRLQFTGYVPRELLLGIWMILVTLFLDSPSILYIFYHNPHCTPCNYLFNACISH